MEPLGNSILIKLFKFKFLIIMREKEEIRVGLYIHEITLKLHSYPEVTGVSASVGEIRQGKENPCSLQFFSFFSFFCIYCLALSARLVSHALSSSFCDGSVGWLVIPAYLTWYHIPGFAMR